MSTGKTVALWIITVLVVSVFLGAGASKLIDYQGMSSAEFEHWNLPVWFMYVIGVVEVVGAVCLFVPAVAVTAAEVLITIMLGAMLIHLKYDAWYWAFLPISLIVGLIIIIWIRKRE